uniref:RRM domain-containing protein n=1 Tax=Globisporangium ultimum (strain ATCC 200006 / CBS 805.95 / DAOM BR144) TaxID=431595 RepID=K3WTZ2_GLOUD
MTTEDAKPMNAKERRKLQREQERLEAEADATAAKKANGKQDEAPDVTTSAPVDTTQLNAKQRRQLAREAERIAKEKADAAAVLAPAASKEDSAAAITAPVAAEKLNAKQRRLLARKLAQPEGEVTEKQPPKKNTGDESKKRKRSSKAKEGAEEDPNKKVKSIHLTLFIGQLPYNATEQKIREHFREAGEIEVRMLTDKRTKKFKGTAFIEVKDSKALGAALSRHHTLMNGRRINVEMTASGGGNKSEQRRTKIDLLRKKQSNVQVEKTKALIQKHIDSPEYKITKDDVDERMIDFLSWFDYETAKKALEEYNRCVGDRVQNRKAFFMGILKRFRETDGVE